MSPGVTIRKLSGEDFPQWKQLYLAYRRTSDAELSEKELQDRMDFLCGVSPQAFCFVALSGKDLVGFAHCILHPCVRTLRNICYLQDLFVAADYRRQGVGRGLIESISEQGRKEGWRRVYWKTQPDNKAAQSVYNAITTADDYIYYKVDFDKAAL